MQNKHITRGQELQERLFHRKFHGASLAKVNLPGRLCERISSWIKDPKGFLVITGEPGTGKTYICSALIDAMSKSQATLRYYNERGLLRIIRQRVSEKTSGDYLGHLQNLLDDEMIIIDDLGSSGHNEWREEVLMEAVDFRYQVMKPTVFTSNLSRTDFYKTYGARIGSRLFATENTHINMEGVGDLRQQGK